MPRTTKAELERDNAELRDKLQSVYDELGEFLGIDEEDDDPEEDDDEEMQDEDHA